MLEGSISRLEARIRELEQPDAAPAAIALHEPLPQHPVPGSSFWSWNTAREEQASYAGVKGCPHVDGLEFPGQWWEIPVLPSEIAHVL